MDRLSEFRSDFVLQCIYALRTGCTVDYLLEKSNDKHGNTKMHSILKESQSTRKPICYLGQDDSLNASISAIKFVSSKIYSLEQASGLSFFEIIKVIHGKHGVSTLSKIINNFSHPEWGVVTKNQIKPLLEEYEYWVSVISDIDDSDGFDSAKDVFEYLSKNSIRQLTTLYQLQQLKLPNWNLDLNIFNNIVKGLQVGSGDFVSEWMESYQLFNHYNARTHREYRSLFSWMVLSMLSQFYGYKSNFWATKKDWKRLGCELKENARCGFVFQYFQVNERDSYNDEFVYNNVGFGRKVSIVYNSEEVCGGDLFDINSKKIADLNALEKVLEDLAVNIVHSHDAVAFYHPLDDTITMPSKELFKGKKSAKSYYATLLHELIHWTSHENRCNRKLGIDFNDEDYVFEELVAEIGSAFLCSRFGISKNVRKKSIEYISSWLNVKHDDSWISKLERAAFLANRASNFIYIPK